MIEIKTAGKQEVPTNVKALIASNQGALATNLAVTMPNVLVASTGGQAIPLALQGVRYTEVESEIDLYNLKVALTGTKEEVTERFGSEVDTLVIDCIDEFQRRILLERLKSQKRIDTNYEDWNWISQRLNAIYAGLNELDINIVTISHLSNIDETSAVKPNIQGAFGTQIHNYVDFAFLLAASEEELVALADVSVDSTSDNITISTTEIATRAYLLTKASAKAEWVHDDTGLLPRIIDLTFDSELDILFDSLKAISDASLESSTLVIEDKVEEETQEEEPTEGDVAEAVVPGMTSAVGVKDLLAQRRAKQEAV